MGTYDLYEIIMKLNGEVIPYGCTSEDRARAENLESLICLAWEIIYKIKQVAAYSERHEESIKVLGVRAKEFLGDLHESLGDYIDEETEQAIAEIERVENGQI